MQATIIALHFFFLRKFIICSEKKTIDFDATNNGSVNAADKRKSIVFMDRTSDGNSQTSICTGRPFDPKTTVFIDKGLSEAVPNPENRLDYTDINGNVVYNQNYFPQF